MSNKKTKLNYYYTEIKKLNEFTSLEKEYKLAQINISNLIFIYKIQCKKRLFENFVNNFKYRSKKKRSFISQFITDTIISINKNNKSFNKFRLTNTDNKDENLYTRTIRDYFRNKYIIKQ